MKIRSNAYFVEASMTKQKVLSDDTIPIFVSGRPLAVFGPGVISSGFVSGLKV
jgi:hypothetical protein